MSKGRRFSQLPTVDSREWERPVTGVTSVYGVGYSVGEDSPSGLDHRQVQVGHWVGEKV